MADAPVALVTGGARRIGAAIARALHDQGYRLLIHYNRSRAPAEALQRELVASRADSCAVLCADLSQPAQVAQLARTAEDHWQRLDLLVNNASSFYPTPLGSIDAAAWDELMATNLRAPLFLSQALAPALRRGGGGIVNIVDIYASRPLRNHSVYCLAKAGLAMLTRSLALELAPAVRVNGVAPGAILWPEADNPEIGQRQQEAVLAKIPLARTGEPENIAEAVCYLARSTYTTGEILSVDGGRLLV